MKHFITLLTVSVAMIMSSCSYDDTDIWDKLNEFEGRLKALEELCAEMNTNISSLETLVEALDNGDSITNIAEVKRDGKVIGYTITFASGDSITIYNGEDGEDGYVPTIGVAKGEDGAYYWTVDGEWLTDDKGNKVKAEGSGATPKLKIENNYWYVSYDDGKSWQQLGEAVGEGGEGLFKSVTYDNEYVYFTLANGTVLALPRVVGVTPPADTPSGETNKIYYTTSDGKKMFPNDSGGAAFGAILISNSYVDGVGVLIFDDIVTTIGGSAFSYCSSLTSVTIPNSVTTIGRCAFFWCTSLTSVTIGDSVTTIGEWAFENCDSLTSITIPDSVTSISSSAFEGCNSLTEFKGSGASSDGLCIINNKGVLLYFLGKALTEYIIPDGVTTIGESAFASCTSLTSVTLPDSVTTIGDYAFYSCSSLTSVAIPNSVTEIGDSAFYDCDSLTSVNIPDSVTTIGDSAFSGCTGELIINSKIVETDYDYNNAPSRYGWLKGSNFSSLTIGNGVTTIGDFAFFDCYSLTSVTIGDSVTTIGNYAFCSCTSLTSVNIPNSVTTIGDDAFYSCRRLTSVTIPDSVTTISSSAFWGCDSLTSVYCKATTPPSLGSEVFDYNHSDRKIYVPTGSVSAYKSATYWSDYAYAIVGYDF